MTSAFFYVPIEDEEIEVEFFGYGSWIDESASTDRGYFEHHVFRVDEVEYMTPFYSEKERGYIDEFLLENKERIIEEIEINAY